MYNTFLKDTVCTGYILYYILNADTMSLNSAEKKLNKIGPSIEKQVFVLPHVLPCVTKNGFGSAKHTQNDWSKCCFYEYKKLITGL